MTLNSLFCADVPLSNYSLTPPTFMDLPLIQCGCLFAKNDNDSSWKSL